MQIYCKKCQSPNPNNAKFCSICGTSLIQVCSNCGSDLLPAAKFCSNCGQPQAQPPQAVLTPIPETDLRDISPALSSSEFSKYVPSELRTKLEAVRDSGGFQDTTTKGERRIVTMVFCDIQGSTATASQLDPEEWHEIVNGAFEHMIAPVYQYEGTIARLLGDGILAFFGAPIAHEDDPQRAVLASLGIMQGIQTYREKILQEWGLDINVRIGINTGLVVVGGVGSDLRMEYTALGDAINLAARMEQTAEPGTIQLTDSTHKLIAPFFEFENIGKIDVKGKPEPIQTFRVLRVISAPGQIRGIEGLDAPLIGRDHEMQALQAVIKGLGEGRGQIVSIIGEAGLGKSRLIAELHNALPQITNQVNPPVWIEGRSLSYETSIPYAIFIDLLSQHFSIQSSETAKEQYEQIVKMVSEVVSEQIQDITPFLASLLGIEPSGDHAERIRYLTPPQLRQKIYLAVCNYLEALATRNSLIVVLDDVHWSDPSSLELIKQLLPLTVRIPLVLIALFRPRRQEPSWQLHEIAGLEYGHFYTSLLLQPLDQDNSQTLVASLLQVNDLPLKVRKMILDKSEGNPFYMEEVIRSLLDGGFIVRKNGHWRAVREIEKISVPDTLSAVITTRLDQLEEQSRLVAQTASVIGRQFQYPILESVYMNHEPLDETLTDLQRRELIREKSRTPQRLYMFKHSLTQETVYNTLLLKRRQELHTSVATYLEQNEPSRVNEIARHYLDARKPAKALPYLVKAGKRAAHAYSTEEAIGFFSQAINLFEQTDVDISLVRETFEGLGGTLELAYDFPNAAENYRQMITFGEKYNNVPVQVSGMNKLARVKGMGMANFQEALSLLTDAEQMATDANDLHGIAEGSMIQCAFCTAQANFDDAVNYLQKAVYIGRQLEMDETRLYGLTHISNTYTFMALFDEAWQISQEAQDLAIKTGNKQYLAELLTFPIAFYHLRNGDLEMAWQCVQEGAEIASQIGSMLSQINGNYILGYLSHLKGAYENALNYYNSGLNLVRDAGLPFMEAMFLCLIGSVYLEIGSAFEEKTLIYHDQAEKLLATPGGSMMGALVWAEFGSCAIATGKYEAAKTYFQQGLTTQTAMMHLARPQLLVGSAYVNLFEGHIDAASQNVQEANDYIEKRKMKYFIPLVSLVSGKVLLAKGEIDAALEHFVQAEESARNQGLLPMIWQARLQIAETLKQVNRDQEAEEKYGLAVSVFTEIEGFFNNSEYRDVFAEKINPIET